MRDRIDRIEAAIHRDVGRGMDVVFRETRGALWAASGALAANPAPRIGLITGFYVPGGDPPAAETDGPAGAALLARAFHAAGVPCRLSTDTGCAAAASVALRAAGAASIPIDAIQPGQGADSIVDLWRSEGIDWVIAIERCGPSRDGRPRNMRGLDISAYVAPLDRLFSAGPWRTIAIGDGGNELGMGNLPTGLMAAHAALGEVIACVVPADFLIVAGVSHWGAYALLGALSLLRPAWVNAMRQALDPDLDEAVVTAMVQDGPAVDGVSLQRTVTIDGQPMTAHHAILAAIHDSARS